MKWAMEYFKHVFMEAKDWAEDDPLGVFILAVLLVLSFIPLGVLIAGRVGG